MDMFPGEDACLEYLSIVRWPDAYKCLRCGNADYWKKARGLFGRKPYLGQLHPPDVSRIARQGA